MSNKKRNHDKTRGVSAYNLFVKENHAQFKFELEEQDRKAPAPPPSLGLDGQPIKPPSMFIRVSKLAAERWKAADQEHWKQKARELSAAAAEEEEEEPKPKKKKHKKESEHQQEQESKGPECCVCLEPFRVPDRLVSMFAPCGHWCCDSCHHELKEAKCPVCRMQIDSRVRSTALTTEFEELAKKKIKAPAAAAAPEGPKVGDVVDAKDKDDVWYEAKIIGVETRYRVRFIGWEDEDDETVGKDRLAPLKSQSQPQQEHILAEQIRLTASLLPEDKKQQVTINITEWRSWLCRHGVGDLDPRLPIVSSPFFQRICAGLINNYGWFLTKREPLDGLIYANHLDHGTQGPVFRVVFDPEPRLVPR